MRLTSYVYALRGTAYRINIDREKTAGLCFHIHTIRYGFQSVSAKVLYITRIRS